MSFVSFIAAFFSRFQSEKTEIVDPNIEEDDDDFEYSYSPEDEELDDTLLNDGHDPFDHPDDLEGDDFDDDEDM